MNQKPHFYAPEIDGLRFGAAFLVFFHHAPGLPYLFPLRDYGWVGVDLFLAISAFLLTRLLDLEWQAHGKIRFGAFFVRRALRIWPLFFFYATAMCIYSLVQGATDLSTTFAWWLSLMSFTNNLLTALQGYSPVPFTAHLWTIALEEQAYAILPLVLIVFFGSGINRAAFLQGAAVLLGILILARTAFSTAGAPHPFIWVLPLRADPFIIGVSLALILHGKGVKHPFFLLIAGMVLVSSVVVFPSFRDPGAYQIFGYTIIALGCVLIVSATQARTVFSRLLSIAPLRYLGKISYGIYVYHLLCIGISEAFARKLDLSSSVSTDLFVWIVAFALTILLSMVSYAVLEKPFLRLKQRYSLVASRPI